ncbi:MAG: S-layer homology domain-containing protein [Firmicutes bacterium]|nr:S-layer homology domain-containing protein [Bacillota bacterium]
MKRLFVLLVLGAMMLAPRAVFAETYDVHTAEQFKAAVEGAEDGDTIVVRDLKEPKDFGGASIDVEKDLAITSNMEYATGEGGGETYIRVYETAVLKDVGFDVAAGKTLSLSNVEIYGGKGTAPVGGEGNLVLSTMAGIEANGTRAVDLPKGEVKVEGIKKLKDPRKGDFDDLKRRVREELAEDGDRSVHIVRQSERIVNGIRGGDATGEGTAHEAIRCEHFVMKDTSNKAFHIEGGNSERGEGAFAVAADVIDVNIRQAIPINPILIRGGSGRYPGGAIRGKTLHIVAGHGGISANVGLRPGACTVKDHGIVSGGEHDVGVVDVEDGGVLEFGQGIDWELESQLSGFGRSYFHGPTILARGDAEVNIYGGIVEGAVLSAFDLERIDVAPRAVIETGTGELNIASSKSGTTVRGGRLCFGNLEAVIRSRGDVRLSGRKVAVEGPAFVTRSVEGYEKADVNDGMPLRGAAGIETTGTVTVTGGARVSGGSIDDTALRKIAEKGRYRKGSGVVGAQKVIVSNGAIVQGNGSHEYLEGVLGKSGGDWLKGISSGHGVEDAGELIVDGGFVHGGDLCAGKGVSRGTGGSGVKNVARVLVRGDALVTGGSSTNGEKTEADFFTGQPAGDAVDNREIAGDVVRVSGAAKLCGGNSGKRGGHGIVGSDDIVVEGDALIRGGACKALSTGSPAGCGICEAKDVTISGGCVEAGSRPYQQEYDYLRKSMASNTREGNFPGDSREAVAIDAAGTVVVDGAGEAYPKIVSHHRESPVVRLSEGGALILGRGDAAAGSADANLVEGGMYHVDIFKDNRVNAVRLVDSNDPGKGLKYNDRSTPLFRILNEDGENDVDAAIEGAAPIELKGYKLYKKDTPVKFNLLAYERKLSDQGTSFGAVAEDDSSKRTVEKMPADNVLIEKPVPYATVTFDLNDETSGEWARLVAPEGRALGERFPENPTRKGYEMTGWNTAPDGTGVPFTEKSPVSGDITVYAQWKEKTPAAKPGGDGGGKRDPGLILVPKCESGTHAAYLFGYPGGEFKPESTMTRAEASAMFVRLLNQEPPAADVRFSDVDDGDWYRDAVARALGAGLFKGYGDGSFKPNAPMTRAEFAAVAARFDGEVPIEANPADFSDVDAGHWAYRAITSGRARGRLRGYEDGSFRPDKPMTRAEVATLANKMLDRRGDEVWIDAHNTEVMRFSDLDEGHWAYDIVVEATNGHDFERRADGKGERWLGLNDSGRR